MKCQMRTEATLKTTVLNFSDSSYDPEEGVVGRLKVDYNLPFQSVYYFFSKAETTIGVIPAVIQKNCIKQRFCANAWCKSTYVYKG